MVPDFLPICDVLFNVVSLASYFCDIVFDIIATYTFFVSGLKAWFWLSIISIVFSLVTCQLLSARWMLVQERHRNMSRRRLALLSMVHGLGGGMVWRYSLLFAPIQLEHVKQEMRNLCVLRMIHGFAESMTLLLIQLYIACTNADLVKEINVISMALSLFNVCWALASFTKNIRQHNVHRLVLTWLGVIFQFVWRLGTVTSRVLVLVLYSTVYTYWVFLVVALHWITMMLWVLSRYAAFKAEKLTRWQKVGLSVFVSYIHIFCYVNLEEQSTKLKIVTFYAIMLVENVLLIALWTLGEQYTNGLTGWHRDRIFIAVFSSFFVGLLFMGIYYKFFHVRKMAAALEYSCEQEAEEKARKSNKQGHNTSYSSGDDPAVTVFNCALNPAMRKKKKLPTRPVPSPESNIPFWKEPLPSEERTAGDGLSYSRTTSVDDIRQKLADKKEKQLVELRRIEDDIAAGRLQRPLVGQALGQPIPVAKRQPALGSPLPQWAGQQPPQQRRPPPHHPALDDGLHGLPPVHHPQEPPHRLPDWNRGVSHQLNEHSGQYRSYRDSSGDQGDVDSGDELSLGPGRPTVGQPPPTRQRPPGSSPLRPPGLSPGPRHRERVVIGGYSYETPL